MKLDRLSAGAKIVSDVAMEMREKIGLLGGERGWGETRQRWLERAARHAGISYRTARSFFYREERDPRSTAVEKVRRAVAAMTNEAAVADRYQELTSRIATLEAALLSHQELDRLDPALARRNLRDTGDDRGAMASEVK